MAENNEEEPLIRSDSPTVETDFTNNRDPKQITEDMDKVDFEDVIAEPAGVHSVDRVWKFSFNTFTVSKFWCYRGLTAIFGLPLSLLWGLVFACLSFWQIWVVVPSIKSCMFVFHCLCRPLLQVTKTVVRPVLRVVGKIYGSVKGMVRKEA
ncbi:caveolin-3-like [Pagrus major]|uniref:caveolin-3-like n=1 Tax=Pagrus major TaxID=143350 RepID=UPI003CC86BCB